LNLKFWIYSLVWWYAFASAFCLQHNRMWVAWRNFFAKPLKNAFWTAEQKTIHYYLLLICPCFSFSTTYVYKLFLAHLVFQKDAIFVRPFHTSCKLIAVNKQLLLGNEHILDIWVVNHDVYFSAERKKYLKVLQFKLLKVR